MAAQEESVLQGDAHPEASRPRLCGEGETIVQFSYMKSPEHYVKKHTDTSDISHQYALSLGKYTSRTICYIIGREHIVLSI